MVWTRGSNWQIAFNHRLTRDHKHLHKTCTIHHHTVLYKLPKFYNAYATGGSTMFFFLILELWPGDPGGHSRPFQLEGIYSLYIYHDPNTKLSQFDGTHGVACLFSIDQPWCKAMRVELMNFQIHVWSIYLFSSIHTLSEAHDTHIYYHIWSNMIMYYHMLSYIIIYYRASSNMIIYYHIWSYSIIYCHILSHIIIHYSDIWWKFTESALFSPALSLSIAVVTGRASPKGMGQKLCYHRKTPKQNNHSCLKITAVS